MVGFFILYLCLRKFYLIVQSISEHSHFYVGCFCYFMWISFRKYIVCHTYVCKMRKEVNIGEVVIGRLQILADKKKWSLKQYMEFVLEKDSLKASKSLIEKPKAIK